MLITKTGPGRRGTLDQGVGTLTVKSSSPEEARGLLVLTIEVEKNFGFWTPIMFAAQEEKLTKVEIKTLERVISRIKKSYDEFVEQGE